MIVFKNVLKRYGGIKVLDGINLNIQTGEAVAIIGPSGSGKTTLIRTINGFVVPDSGVVSVNGDVVDYSNKKFLRNLRKKIGMIYQLFNLVERASALENVLSGCLGRHDNGMGLLFSTIGFFSKEEKELAMELLRFVGLEHKAFERVDRLSGGEKQRVAIARALMQKPDILLADEPIANLDPKTSKKIIELLLRINEEKKITLICVLHHLETVENNFKRIIALNRGKIIYDGFTSSLNRAELLAIYEESELCEAA
ncbi:MAG: phosphonate ABC transporter ATP-binding protein [Caldimicrobium sp.]|nr:phosphonate ABC transporter ATP-binding protein [Caldimicrobium sp.]MCX7874246.1 phosphonate ABC transporter ATP-binding protein [Caldimicrobium sp.]MDW8094775.1 phosphonate ABC transporter ATP-binding protein [Caldimicrobium sp.]